MNIYLLNKIRKIFKSIGKYEYKILDKITLLENKKVIIKDKDFNSLENKFNFPKKIAITICFHFKKNKIKNLVNSCSSIENCKFFKEVLIIINAINKNEMKLLQSKITKKCV